MPKLGGQHHIITKRGQIKNVTSGKLIKRVEQRRTVMLLRRDGWTYDEISTATGLAQFTIHQIVVECLDMNINELKLNTEQEREIQKNRLDALLKTHLPLAIDSHKEVRTDRLTGLEVIVEVPPDPIHAGVVLKVEERRAKLLALDTPEVKKLEVTGIREYRGIDLEKI